MSSVPQFPHVPSRGVHLPAAETQAPMGYGKGVPPCKDPSSALSPPTWGEGRQVPPRQPGKRCRSWGSKFCQALRRGTWEGG